MTALIESAFIQQDALGEDFFIDHERLESVAIGGLDAYYTVALEGRYAYASPDKQPKSL